MEHDIRNEGNVLVVSLRGDVDLEQSPAARKVLLECVGRGGNVLVDLSGVGYIDSSGVASLVEAYQAARKAQTAFALAAVSAGAMRVLELARLNKVFAIHDSLEAGLESLE